MTTGKMPRRRRRIEQDTQLMPVIIADRLITEASAALQTDLPSNLSDNLVQKAQVLYFRDDEFARMIHGPGDSGRDGLRSHMRRWLVERLSDRHPDLQALMGPRKN